MKRIEITRGGCGIKYKDANGNERHALKTAEHGPFECDDTQADRLVSLGVAKYVGAAAAAAAPANQNEGEGEETQGAETITGHLDAAQLETMTNEQLKNLAGDLGVDVTGCKKKADFVAAIMAVEVEAEVDGDDELPELDAADPE